MMQQIINDYFSFTKKERRGIFVLLAIILLLLFFPYFFSPNRSYQKLDEKLQQQIAQLEIIKDTNNNSFAKQKYFNNNFEESRFTDYSPRLKVYDNQNKGELFYFDPNSINVAGWQKLGVSEKTANTIINYTSKGGQFRTAEDIGKIYGLSDYMVERLMPFVQIEKSFSNYEKKEYQNSFASNTFSKQENNATTQNTPTKKMSEADFLNSYKIDINTADTIAWKKLPGIGSALSARIVNYRNKLGGFSTVNQVAETYGLPDSTFQKIKGTLLFTVNNELTKININTATAEQLKHPYLTKSLINNIIQYRNQHGKFTTLSDLKKLALMDENTLQRITPYLSLE